MGAGGDGAVREAQKAVTVGYHAPPPGSATGVADYAETLLPALKCFGQVEASARGDIDLYHLGNNRLHEQIYAQALERPGVVVLHDAVLHHFFLGTRTHDEYVDEWIYNYGEWRRDLGEELWRERGRSGVDHRYFEFPMLRRIAERSRAVIVHNPGAAAMACAHGAKRVEVIPHFVVPATLPDAAATLAFRQRMGVEPGARLLGMFGYLREPKRVMTCLSAFRELHAARPDTALLLAGEPVSRDLARLLDQEAPHPAIRRTGHLSEEDLMIAAAAVDACLNLRFPAAGETSGIAVRLMGMGKPVVVSDIAENSAFPVAAVLRVCPGVAERSELFDHMVLLAAFPRVARDIGEQARMWMDRHHALAAVARKYWEVLCASV
jgi:glycosyltransferase involved in cell wall biosynthesis